jgi:hypothetical protein
MQSTTIIGWLDGPIPAHAAAAYVDVDNAIEVDVRAVLVGLARRAGARRSFDAEGVALAAGLAITHASASMHNVIREPRDSEPREMVRCQELHEMFYSWHVSRLIMRRHIMHPHAAEMSWQI